jgi:AraC-like DNA-binding protein
MMSAQTILWVDLRTIRSEPDLCSSLSPLYRTQRLHHLPDLFQTVQNWRPWAMCFEYDIPDARGLAALLEISVRHASLPIIMLTEKCVRNRELLALRDSVWVHLVKPVSVRRFCECVTGLGAATTAAVRPAVANGSAGEAIVAGKSWTAGSLAPAVSYVAANYSEKLRLSTAAKLCDLSRFQFSRNFKKEQGLTFRDFVVQLRIQRAAELMKQSRALSVTEAAFVVGFNDLSHFSRMFRRQFGVTPSHYRRADSEPNQLSLFAPDNTKAR